MRRHLVLTSESARHPFRASLPALAVRPGLTIDDDTTTDEANGRRARAIVLQDDNQDWKLFLLSFFAFFTAISAFIA
jgi:hypothetical protein